MTKKPQVDVNDEETWAVCTFPGCDNRVDPRRVALLNGLCICLDHGERPKQFTVASAYNKGGLQLITHGDIEDIGK